MDAELVFAPEVEHDISEAYAWYERQRVGLGEEFLTCVDACVQAIRRTADRYAAVHERYRRGLVRRFPYAVFYEYADEEERLQTSPLDASLYPRREKLSGEAEAPMEAA